MPPLGDVAAAMVTKEGILLDDRLERTILVAQYHDMPVGLMAEEIEYAELLHPARDEGQSGFAILHAKVERLIAAGQPAHLVIGEAVFGADRLGDLRERQVLKDPDHPVERSGLGTLALDPDRHVGAD